MEVIQRYSHMGLDLHIVRIFRTMRQSWKMSLSCYLVMRLLKRNTSTSSDSEILLDTVERVERGFLMSFNVFRSGF